MTGDARYDFEAMIGTPGELPRYAAPEGGRLTDAMLRDYAAAGVLVLEDFVSAAACEELTTRALDLVAEFDPDRVASVFSTTGHEQLDDRYFIESGDRIRFFLEREALDETGRLTRPKAESLNTMGHAMHDIDPVFRRFSHTPELAEVASRVHARNDIVW